MTSPCTCRRVRKAHEVDSSRSYLDQVLSELCVEIGAAYVPIDDFGRVGYIEYRSGKRVFFKNTCFDINPFGASKIAQDKDYCAKMLRRAGINSPPGEVIVSPRYKKLIGAKNHRSAATWNPYEDAIRAIGNATFPLYIKPNDQSNGDGVARAYSAGQALEHIAYLFQRFDHVLIQPQLQGSEYRVVVLDDSVVLAYRKAPLSVTGDGRRSIAELCESALRRREGGPAEPVNYEEIRRHLERSGRTGDDIAVAGDVVELLPNANISSGGSLRDVSTRVHPQYDAICRKATRSIGLRFSGVDIICDNIEKFDPNYVVLEVNAGPGFYNFGSLGNREHCIVTALYKKLIHAMQAGAGCGRDPEMAAGGPN